MSNDSALFNSNSSASIEVLPSEEQESDSNQILSIFSPLAFMDCLNISTDALPDEESKDEDEDFGQQELESSGKRLHIHESRLTSPTGAAVAGPSYFATPWLGRRDAQAETFSPTPYKMAIRHDYSRATIWQKASIMHIYGGYDVLTLFAISLHMCHVLAVATSDQLLKQVARGIGEDDYINISSSLNFWILTSTFHHAVDTGIIKFIPHDDVLDAMTHYLDELHKLRLAVEKGKISSQEYNKHINGNLRRKQLFLPANYPYRIVGVLCPEDFIIPQYEVDQDVEIPAEEVHNEGSDFQITIRRFPIPLPRPVSDPPFLVGLTNGDFCLYKAKSQPGTGIHQAPTWRSQAGVLPQFRSISPKMYNEDEVFWLWQDQFFVVVNVGEFLHTLSIAWKRGNTGAEFMLIEYVKDERHRTSLLKALQLYRTILHAPAPPATEQMRESPSRPQMPRTRSRTKNSGPATSQFKGKRKERDSSRDHTCSSRRLKHEEPEMMGRDKLPL
ncbi:hypothetical protein E1B28_003578 [Marasmius oreades]|uniref:Uncharacterized protein n=1 Tax=Marasmius oreades TaxID=181124 RepID=A0A9P7UKT9_9AGAR|nr:uncharacterized protein E1B28_003578 [Marasmius oreades]KAG7086058.1 hypothetical protein E1B28_003578 [Marasmius oreades]